MGMDLDGGGSKRRVKPVMNITPLVDVVLVLLIIFMVVTPMMAKQLWLDVPPKPEDNLPPPTNALPPLVVTLGKDHLTRVNTEVIAREQIAGRLVRMLNARPDKVVFFDADSSLSYGEAVEMMDQLRTGGVQTIAVLADPVASEPLAAASQP
jgi:biopolymer transport protein TolR